MVIVKSPSLFQLAASENVTNISQGAHLNKMNGWKMNFILSFKMCQIDYYLFCRPRYYFAHPIIDKCAALLARSKGKLVMASQIIR